MPAPSQRMPPLADVPPAVRPLLLVIPLCLSFPKGIRFSDQLPRIAYHSSSLPARLQQLPRMLQTRLRQLCAAQHPRPLACPLVLIHPPDRRSRPSTLLLLFNRKMLVRKRRNLRQMRNAHHLLPLRQRLQLAPHRLRRPAPILNESEFIRFSNSTLKELYHTPYHPSLRVSSTLRPNSRLSASACSTSSLGPSATMRPLDISSTRSISGTMSRSSWVTRMIPVPEFASARMVARRSCWAAMSSELQGSSKSNRSEERRVGKEC